MRVVWGYQIPRQSFSKQNAQFPEDSKRICVRVTDWRSEIERLEYDKWVPWTSNGSRRYVWRITARNITLVFFSFLTEEHAFPALLWQLHSLIWHNCLLLGKMLVLKCLLIFTIKIIVFFFLPIINMHVLRFYTLRTALLLADSKLKTIICIHWTTGN